MSIAGYEIFKDGKKQGNLQGVPQRREMDKLRKNGYILKKIYHKKTK